MRPPPFSLCICAHSQCCAKVDHLLRRAGAYKFSSIKSNCKQSNYSYFIFCKSITKHIKMIFAKYPFIIIFFCKVSYFIKKNGICDFYFRVTSVSIIFPRLMTSMVFLTLRGRRHQFHDCSSGSLVFNTAPPCELEDNLHAGLQRRTITTYILLPNAKKKS